MVFSTLLLATVAATVINTSCGAVCNGADQINPDVSFRWPDKDDPMGGGIILSNRPMVEPDLDKIINCTIAGDYHRQPPRMISKVRRAMYHYSKAHNLPYRGVTPDMVAKSPAGIVGWAYSAWTAGHSEPAAGNGDPAESWNALAAEPGATDTNRTAVACFNYEMHHGLPSGCCTLDQVSRSSAGLDGWYDYSDASADSRTHSDYHAGAVTGPENGKAPLWETLNLTGNVLAQPHKTRLQAAFAEYDEIFHGRPDGKLPLFHDENGKVVYHRIRTVDDDPINIRPYRCNPNMLDCMTKTVNEMVACGHAYPCNTSSYGFPMLLVPKNDPDDPWRAVVDYRRLNLKTPKYTAPMTTQEDIFDMIGAATTFSVIDLRRWFWQHAVDPQDQHKTVFVTPHMGAFACNTIPMGLSNAPQICQNATNTMFRQIYNGPGPHHGKPGLGHFVNGFQDDLLVWSGDEYHIDYLIYVFKCMALHNVLVKPSKLHLFQERVNFIGHYVDRHGIHVDPEKVSAIRDQKPPTSAAQVRSFIGMVQYHRKHIPNFSDIAKPLTDLTAKGVVFAFTAECLRAFNILKHLLIQAPILKPPDWSKPMILRTDASGIGLGGSLCQMYDDGRRVIEYFSKKLTPTEQNYDTRERECYSIVWAFSRMTKYLMGRRFILENDHLNIKYLNDVTTHAGGKAKLYRWSTYLQGFDFELRHRPGTSMKEADYLSRYFPEPVGPDSAGDPADLVDEDLDFFKPTSSELTPREAVMLQSLSAACTLSAPAPSLNLYVLAHGVGGDVMATSGDFGVQYIGGCDTDEVCRKIMGEHTGVPSSTSLQSVIEGIKSGTLTIPHIHILSSGMPCQQRSQARNLNGTPAPGTPPRADASLFLQQIEFVKLTRPDFCLFEMVPPINSTIPEFREVEEAMKKLGYSYNTAVLNAARYGGLSARKRYYLQANRSELSDEPFEWPEPVTKFQGLRGIMQQAETIPPSMRSAYTPMPLLPSRSEFEPRKVGTISLGGGHAGKNQRVYDPDYPCPTITTHYSASTNGANWVLDSIGARLYTMDEQMSIMGYVDEIKNKLVNLSKRVQQRLIGNGVCVVMLSKIYAQIHDWFVRVQQRQVYRAADSDPPTVDAVVGNVMFNATPTLEEIAKAQQEDPYIKPIYEYLSRKLTAEELQHDPRDVELAALITDYRTLNDQNRSLSTADDLLDSMQSTNYAKLDLSSDGPWYYHMAIDPESATKKRAPAHLEMELLSGPYKRQLPNMILSNGVVHLREETGYGSIVDVIVLPAALVLMILAALHDSPHAGHGGIKATVRAVRSRFFWPRLADDVKKYIADCTHCKRAKATRNHHVGKPAFQLYTHPWQRLAIDLMGPFQPAPNGDKYVFHICDVYSGFSLVDTIPNKAMTTIARSFYDNCLSVFGSPLEVLSDRGSEFLNRVMAAVESLFGYSHIKTTSYAPKGNSQNERCHRYYNGVLRICHNSYRCAWTLGVRLAAWSMNTTSYVGTEITPFELCFGRKPRGPLDVGMASPDASALPGMSPGEYVKLISLHQSEVADLVTDARLQQHRRNDAHNRRLRYNIKYNVGDLILLWRPNTAKGETTRLLHQNTGPFEVLAQKSESTYEVQKLGRASGPVTVNVTHMSPYVTREAHEKATALETEDDLQDSGTSRTIITDFTPETGNFLFLSGAEPLSYHLCQVISFDAEGKTVAFRYFNTTHGLRLRNFRPVWIDEAGIELFSTRHEQGFSPWTETNVPLSQFYPCIVHPKKDKKGWHLTRNHVNDVLSMTWE